DLRHLPLTAIPVSARPALGLWGSPATGSLLRQRAGSSHEGRGWRGVCCGGIGVQRAGRPRGKQRRAAGEGGDVRRHRLQCAPRVPALPLISRLCALSVLPGLLRPAILLSAISLRRAGAVLPRLWLSPLLLRSARPLGPAHRVHAGQLIHDAFTSLSLA